MIKATADSPLFSFAFVVHIESFIIHAVNAAGFKRFQACSVKRLVKRFFFFIDPCRVLVFLPLVLSLVVVQVVFSAYFRVVF